MPDEDRPDKRSPGAADEATSGAEQEPGLGQEPDTSPEKPAEDVPTQIDVEEIRPEIDKEQQDVES